MELISIVEFNETIDLDDVFNRIEIGSLKPNIRVIGARIGDKCKGDINNSHRMFYNNILVKVLIDDKLHRMKMFRNKAIITPKLNNYNPKFLFGGMF